MLAGDDSIFQARAGDFRVLGEDADYLAVDKPAGLLVHPTRPGGPRTLWEGLRELLGYELATGGQISIINRLDRETSGVVVVAKSREAARQAGLAMEARSVRKTYLAIVFGHPTWKSRVVDIPILRRGEHESSPVFLERMAHPSGAVARTRFRVLALGEGRGAAYALVAAYPETGRTHQIRVHLAHVGHPVLGDKLYARGSGCYLEFIRDGWTPSLEERLLLPRHALHCVKMELAGRVWQSPPPLAQLLAFCF